MAMTWSKPSNYMQTAIAQVRAVTLSLLAAMALFPSPPVRACTTAVISSKATQDGRPVLWKNRDFWQPDNEVVYFHEAGLAFVAVVNAGARHNVYMGTNTAGFCIENSVSNDIPGKSGDGPGNGRLMKRALSQCTTVDDFERLLQATNVDGRRTRANFGVIDAYGGAAMFETGPTSFVKLDANDPRAAPQGFIVRSNFSATGRKLPAVRAETPLEGVYSAERFRRGCRLCGAGIDTGRFDVHYVLRNVARDLCDEAGRPLPGSVNGNRRQPLPIAFDTSATVNRRTTVSAAVFQGVRSGENPALTTMWVLLGQPAFSVAVPCWAAAGGVDESLDGPVTSRLGTLSRKLRDLHYPAQDAVLHRGAIERVWHSTFPVEDALYRRTQQRLAEWRRQAPSSDVLAAWHRAACGEAVECLEALCRSEKVLLSARPPAIAAKVRDDAVRDDAVRVDFLFDEADGTPLDDVADGAGNHVFDGGHLASVVQNGCLRIRGGFAETVNRYADIAPDVGAGGNSGGDNARVPRGWIVLRAAGWRLEGGEPNERLRFGFASRPDSAYQTAAFVVARHGPDRVALGGEAFGKGGENVEPTALLPARQTEPVTFVIELDKIARNSNEGDAGGVYRLFYRVGDRGPFKQAKTAGRVRRLRNGAALHLGVSGEFGDDGEYFDIDRLYYTTANPLVE